MYVYTKTEYKNKVFLRITVYVFINTVLCHVVFKVLGIYCSIICIINTVFPRLDAWASISRLCVACPTSKGAEASI